MQILRVDGTRPLEAIYGTTSLFHCFYAVFENLEGKVTVTHSKYTRS